MKRNLIIFGRLWKVQTINYFKDVTNITLGIILTTMTMVCWVAFKAKEGGFVADPFVLASAIGISAIRNSQYNLNLTLTDWRFRGLFKNFSATPISKRLILVSILIFNWFINIMVALLLMGIAMLFEDQRKIIAYVNWPIFLSGFVLNVLLSNVMAIALTFFWRRKDVILVLSLFSYFGPMYLLGLGIPWNVSGNVQWLNDFLYIWPHRYTLAIMQSGWIWNKVPNLAMPLSSQLPGGIEPGTFLAERGFGMGGQLWIPILASFAWIFLFLGLIWLGIRRKFIFGRRGLKTYKGINVHLGYIRRIRKAESLTELNLIINDINERNLLLRDNKTQLFKNIITKNIKQSRKGTKQNEQSTRIEK